MAELIDPEVDVRLLLVSEASKKVLSEKRLRVSEDSDARDFEVRWNEDEATVLFAGCPAATIRPGQEAD